MSTDQRRRPGQDVRLATALASAVMRNQAAEARDLATKILARANHREPEAKP